MQDALDKYTAAISLDPTNVPAFNNRAQACLKLGRLANAERDASKVLELEGNDECCVQAANQYVMPDCCLGWVCQTPANNIKAFFRRAQARASMGSAHLEPALQDLNMLLRLEPNNSAAKEEAQKVHCLNNC